jgi:hypothetical protein
MSRSEKARLKSIAEAKARLEADGRREQANAKLRVNPCYGCRLVAEARRTAPHSTILGWAGEYLVGHDFDQSRALDATREPYAPGAHLDTIRRHLAVAHMPHQAALAEYFRRLDLESV